jgi:hypothetical protein
MRKVSDKSSQENQNTHFMINTFSPKIVSFMGKCEKIWYSRAAVPLQAWSGPEGSAKLRFSDFMTTAQDGGKVVSLRHRPPLYKDI